MTDNLRRLDPSRAVEVLHDGQWVAGVQDAWVRWPDGEWRASVAYSVQYEWGHASICAPCGRANPAARCETGAPLSPGSLRQAGPSERA